MKHTKIKKKQNTQNNNKTKPDNHTNSILKTTKKSGRTGTPKTQNKTQTKKQQNAPNNNNTKPDKPQTTY